MRRVVKWLVGAAGLAALARHRSRRRVATDVPFGDDHDPAEELRRRLAERHEEEEPEHVDAPAAEPVDLDERRAEVHARAHEAIESMRDVYDEPDGPGDDSVA